MVFDKAVGPDQLLSDTLEEFVDFIVVVTAFSDGRLRESHAADLGGCQSAYRVRVSEPLFNTLAECLNFIFVVTTFSPSRFREGYVVDVISCQVPRPGMWPARGVDVSRPVAAAGLRRPLDNVILARGRVRVPLLTFQVGDALLGVVLVHQQMVAIIGFRVQVVSMAVPFGAVAP